MTRYGAVRLVQSPRRRGVAVGLAAALTASILITPPTASAVSAAHPAAATSPSQRPPDQKTPLVTSRSRALPVPPAPSVTGSVVQPAPVWPPAADVAVEIPAAMGGTHTFAVASAIHASGTPILLQSNGSQQSAHVKVAARSAAAAAGVDGVLFSVAGLTGGKIGVDYAGFASAGAGFGSRLHLVMMPACALRTPGVPACRRQSVLASTNDAAAHTVSASMPTTSTTRGGAGRRAASTAAAPSGATTFAAVAGASGAGGNFTASSLTPSGTWSVTGASGGFTGPTRSLPPRRRRRRGAEGRAVLQLGRRSTARPPAPTTSPPGSAKAGTISPGFIERTYRTCSDDPTPSTASEDRRPVLGRADRHDEPRTASQSRWCRTTPPSSGTRPTTTATGSNCSPRPATARYNGEYWKITTTDGIQYFFGRNSGPGRTGQAANELDLDRARLRRRTPATPATTRRFAIVLQPGLAVEPGLRRRPARQRHDVLLHAGNQLLRRRTTAPPAWLTPAAATSTASTTACATRTAPSTAPGAGPGHLHADAALHPHRHLHLRPDR